MNLLNATLHCAVVTAVEWRRQPDSAVLTTAAVAPGMSVSCLLDGFEAPAATYDVYARPAGGGDWQRVFEIDPIKRSVARFDL